MIRKIFLFVFLVYCFIVKGQIKDSVKIKIDALTEVFSCSSEFAVYLNNNFKSKEDKVGAIFYWMANHMTLDTKDYFSEKKEYVYNFRYKTQYEKENKINKVNMDLAEEGYKTKKANYLGFVMLFQKLCCNVGVDCEIVEGSFLNSVKNVGRQPVYNNYMWNAFMIEGKWYLVDILSGSGIVNEQTDTFIPHYREMFFMTDPDVFFNNHFPKDEKWLLTDKTAEDFASLPLFYPLYYDSAFSVILPTKGVITQCKDNKLKLELKTPKEFEGIVKLRYSFDSEELPRLPKNIDGFSFEIPLKEIKRDYLTVFLNNKPLVGLKIDLIN